VPLSNTPGNAAQADAEPVDGLTCEGDVTLPERPGIFSPAFVGNLANTSMLRCNIVSGYPKTSFLSQYIGSPFLKDHIRRFFMINLTPIQRFLDRTSTSSLSRHSSTLHIQIYHSASTVYHAPSDLSGLEACTVSIFGLHQIGGKKGYLDMIVVFVERDPEKEGFQSLGVAQVNIFHIPPRQRLIFCAIVHWFETYGMVLALQPVCGG